MKSIMTFFPFWTSWALHTPSVQGLLWGAQSSSPEHYSRRDPQPSGCWGKYISPNTRSPNMWTFKLWPCFWDTHDSDGAQRHLSCKLQLGRLKTAQLHYTRRRQLHKCNWNNLRWVIWDLLWDVLISALLLLFALIVIWLGFCPPEHQVVKLVGGRDVCAGRVELLDSGKWGTVCDDDFNITSGQVVCAQLRCGSAKRVNSFGPGKGNIHISKMKCNGSESNLWECGPIETIASYCGHKEDAGIVCSGTIHM